MQAQVETGTDRGICRNMQGDCRKPVPVAAGGIYKIILFSSRRFLIWRKI
jgi:hypothetical protein